MFSYKQFLSYGQLQQHPTPKSCHVSGEVNDDVTKWV